MLRRIGASRAVQPLLLPFHPSSSPAQAQCRTAAPSGSRPAAVPCWQPCAPPAPDAFAAAGNWQPARSLLSRADIRAVPWREPLSHTVCRRFRRACAATAGGLSSPGPRGLASLLAAICTPGLGTGRLLAGDGAGALGDVSSRAGLKDCRGSTTGWTQENGDSGQSVHENYYAHLHMKARRRPPPARTAGDACWKTLRRFGPVAGELSLVAAQIQIIIV